MKVEIILTDDNGKDYHYHYFNVSHVLHKILPVHREVVDEGDYGRGVTEVVLSNSPWQINLSFLAAASATCFDTTDQEEAKGGLHGTPTYMHPDPSVVATSLDNEKKVVTSLETSTPKSVRNVSVPEFTKDGIPVKEDGVVIGRVKSTHRDERGQLVADIEIKAGDRIFLESVNIPYTGKVFNTYVNRASYPNEDLVDAKVFTPDILHKRLTESFDPPVKDPIEVVSEKIMRKLNTEECTCKAFLDGPDDDCPRHGRK